MLYINSFCIMYSVCICSWWCDVHTCIYFVSSVIFVEFLIKSSFQKNNMRTDPTDVVLEKNITKSESCGRLSYRIIKIYFNVTQFVELKTV